MPKKSLKIEYGREESKINLSKVALLNVMRFCKHIPPSCLGIQTTSQSMMTNLQTSSSLDHIKLWATQDKMF